MIENQTDNAKEDKGVQRRKKKPFKLQPVAIGPE